jgi:hypothetical protein
MLRVLGENGESIFLHHARYKIKPHLRAFWTAYLTTLLTDCIARTLTSS